MPRCGRGFPFDAMRERPQAGHVTCPAMAMPAKARNPKSREQDAHAGQRAKGAGGAINLPSGPAIGQVTKGMTASI
jgi:hypothetical protein